MDQEKHLKIGVDIDGVLIDMDPVAYLQFCEKELGWNVNIEAFKKTHNWHEARPAKSDEEIVESHERFIHEVEDSQKPIEGAHDALKKLGEQAELYLITARTELMREATENLLYQHLPDVDYVEIAMGNMDGKAEKIIHFGVDYYIDDSYREISRILEEKTVNTVVIPFPPFHSFPRWDQIDDERVHWLSVWDEIKNSKSLEEHPEIRKKAWEEIVGLILSDKKLPKHD